VDDHVADMCERIHMRDYVVSMCETNVREHVQKTCEREHV